MNTNRSIFSGEILPCPRWSALECKASLNLFDDMKGSYADVQEDCYTPKWGLGVLAFESSQ